MKKSAQRTKPPKAPKGPGSTAQTSPRVRAHAAARRTTAPPTLQNMPPSKAITIQPSQYARLDIDPAYQRGETPMVNEVTAARIAATGAWRGLEVRKSLSMLDASMGHPHEAQAVKAFLVLAGKVFATVPKALALNALALAFFEHGRQLPDEPTIRALARLNWDSVCETGAVKYRPLVMDAIRQRW